MSVWAIKRHGRFLGPHGLGQPIPDRVSGLRTMLFPTRALARAWIKEHYGFLKSRPDLKSPPHNWRMPVAVKVDVVITERSTER